MFSVGMKLTIETFIDNEVKETFQATIVDLTKKKIFMDFPINQDTGRTGYFLEGSQIRVSFISKGVVYRFQTEIKGRKKLTIPVLEIPYPKKDELIKIQRRKFVRIDKSLDIAIYSLERDIEPLISRTIDISGGGVAVRADTCQFEQGEELDIMIVLPVEINHYAYLSMKGEVISYTVIDGLETTYKLSIKFKSIKEETQEKIIKYCFDEQLERRRKLRVSK
ncbi:flagellar brake protein [Alkalibacillus aidingensis]|uniref:flagellar brake protein n=1 Tax=Alkalibacillus aidingensis TaxID=2747607 RepID=UPI00166187AD|nr:flagellar brake domain-containing protein [Alkalibacillus aidingensis]